MLGLRIRDQVRWHDRWSSEIGRRLQVRDSTNDLFVFDERHNTEEILSLLQEVPPDMYDLFEVKEAEREGCDYQADSGQCYNRT